MPAPPCVCACVCVCVCVNDKDQEAMTDKSEAGDDGVTTTTTGVGARPINRRIKEQSDDKNTIEMHDSQEQEQT